MGPYAIVAGLATGIVLGLFGVAGTFAGRVWD